MNQSANWLARAFARGRTTRAAARPAESKAAPPAFIAMHGAAAAAWTSASYGALSREGFMRNPVVHRCVRMVAEAAAAVPWLAHEDGREVPDHPVLALLDRPNARDSRAVFLETLYGHLLLAGDAFVERAGEGDAQALYPLRPDRVSVVAGPDGWPVAVDYRAGAARRRIPFEGDDGEPRLLHLALFHPLDDLRGFAPLEAALMALDIHNSAGAWNKALLDNAARPSGALVYEPAEGGGMAPEQFEQLRRQLREEYAGAANAGRPLLLEGGLDWKAMGLSPKDMDFIEAKNAASRDIALAFGVPPMLLGIPGDNTYANYAEANRAFYRLTVLPLVARTADAFARWLGGGALRLSPDADAIAGLSAERDALWARLERASFLTEDEKREAVGYGPRT
ncbi:phage portal protein [Oricola thermophila]|uniref:Phage portal protein n=1 Tax=Oricola thermophila TaxID=2742145 RepID=A0A6N1VI13_9HYPH|nr:phage portal protein [Oricola thermophila]QKV18637.1 phage portal protein [Oricola thermophila]